MRQFKEFGIKAPVNGFIGDKIKIGRLLNREIVIHDYRIKPSKYEGNDKCLHLQISIEGTKHVVFTGSAVLMKMIGEVPKENFPFQTTIVKENEHFEFT